MNEELTFQDYLNFLSVNDLIENVKIVPDKKHKSLFSQVVDPDKTMMGEISCSDINNISKMIKSPIVIFNLQKLISMISYITDVEDKEEKTSETKLTIKDNILMCSNNKKSVVYRLGDSSVMEDLDIEKDINYFIAEEQVKFTLTNNEIRELLKALSIAEKDSSLEINIEKDKKRIMLVIGNIDKIFLQPKSSPEFLSNVNEDKIKILLKTKIMMRIFRAILQIPDSSAVIYCKPQYPAIIQLVSPLGDKLKAAFVVAPMVGYDEEK